jgi:hypothetical protein
VKLCYTIFDTGMLLLHFDSFACIRQVAKNEISLLEVEVPSSGKHHEKKIKH